MVIDKLGFYKLSNGKSFLVTAIKKHTAGQILVYGFMEEKPYDTGLLISIIDNSLWSKSNPMYDLGIKIIEFIAPYEIAWPKNIGLTEITEEGLKQI